MARCLRCGAGNEFIEGKVKDEPAPALRGAVEKEIATAIIKAQAALVCGNIDEVAYQIYSIADPSFMKLEPFAEMEKLARITVGNEINKLKAAIKKEEPCDRE